MAAGIVAVAVDGDAVDDAFGCESRTSAAAADSGDAVVVVFGGGLPGVRDAAGDVVVG